MTRMLISALLFSVALVPQLVFAEVTIQNSGEAVIHCKLQTYLLRREFGETYPEFFKKSVMNCCTSHLEHKLSKCNAADCAAQSKQEVQVQMVEAMKSPAKAASFFQTCDKLDLDWYNEYKKSHPEVK